MVHEKSPQRLWQAYLYRIKIIVRLGLELGLELVTISAGVVSVVVVIISMSGIVSWMAVVSIVVSLDLDW